jgi:hypothetical protein
MAWWAAQVVGGGGEAGTVLSTERCDLMLMQLAIDRKMSKGVVIEMCIANAGLQA